MLQARKGGWWDANKVGLSPPLIETPRGWLMIYHGVRHTAGGCLYRLGIALFALDDPEECLLRGDAWIFGPEAPYECGGDVGNVAFPCGYTIDADGDGINLYYGAADTSIALATGRISELLAWLDEHGSWPTPRPRPRQEPYARNPDILRRDRGVRDAGWHRPRRRRALARREGARCDAAAPSRQAISFTTRRATRRTSRQQRRRPVPSTQVIMGDRSPKSKQRDRTEDASELATSGGGVQADPTATPRRYPGRASGSGLR
jgi:hypothetical protein